MDFSVCHFKHHNRKNKTFTLKTSETGAIIYSFFNNITEEKCKHLAKCEQKEKVLSEIVGHEIKMTVENSPESTVVTYRG